MKQIIFSLGLLVALQIDALALNKLNEHTVVGHPIPVTMVVCEEADQVVHVIKAFHRFGQAGSAAMQVYYVEEMGVCGFVESGPTISKIDDQPVYTATDPHGAEWHYHLVKFNGISGVTLVGTKEKAI